MRKDTAAAHEWMPDVAPSHELRRWYGHDPARSADFARRYRAKLADAAHAAALARLCDYARADTVTLLTASVT